VSLPGLVGMPERDVCQYVSDKLGGQTLRIKMTFPYGRMPMVCSLKTSLRCGGRARGRCPGWAFGGTEGRSWPRSGGRSNQRAAVAFPDFPRLTNAGEGADADRRGNTRKEFSWIAAVIHDGVALTTCETDLAALWGFNRRGSPLLRGISGSSPVSRTIISAGQMYNFGTAHTASYRQLTVMAR